MLTDNLKTIIANNFQTANSFYVRNLLKENLQFYVLDFIYSHREYKKLIFTGGTCLRRCYQLPRLSEDLDFDYEGKFSLKNFALDLENHFQKKLQLKSFTTKIGNLENRVFLKFPIMKDLGFDKNSESNLLFVRCDFAPNQSKKYKLESHLISSSDFSFVIQSFDLSTLFANKILALLQRQFKKGNEQQEPFKGRDVYDLAWFIEQSKKGGWNLKPNLERLYDLSEIKSKNELKKKIEEKLNRIENQSLKLDLNPFFPDQNFVTNFVKNYRELILPNLEKII